VPAVVGLVATLAASYCWHRPPKWTDRGWLDDLEHRFWSENQQYYGEYED
jgi:hypothetical protein